MRGISRYRSLVAITVAVLLLAIRLLLPMLGDVANLLAVLVAIAGLVLAFGFERWWVVLPPSRRRRGLLDTRDVDQLSEDGFADWVLEILARSGGRGLAASRGLKPGVVEGWTADRRRVRAVCLHVAKGGHVRGLPTRGLRLDETHGSANMVLLITNGIFEPHLEPIAIAQGVRLIDGQALEAWTRNGAILR